VTVVIGVLALSAAVFVLDAAAGGSLIPPRVLERQLGHEVDFGQLPATRLAR
jgi:hypothetical protein